MIPNPYIFIFISQYQSLRIVPPAQILPQLDFKDICICATVQPKDISTVLYPYFPLFNSSP